MVYTLCNGKAIVEDLPNIIRLTSYKTVVCEIIDRKVHLLTDWDCSTTTVKHVRTFLEQYGFEAGTKKEIAERYLGV